MKKLVLHSQVTGESIHLHVQVNGRLLVTLDDVTFPVEVRMEEVKGAKVGAVPRIWVPGLDDRKPAATAAPAAVAAPVEVVAVPVEAPAEKPAEAVVSEAATRRKRRGATSEEQVNVEAPAAVAAPVVEAVAEPETPVASE